MTPLKRELAVAGLSCAFLMSAGRLNVSSGVSPSPQFLINQQRLIPVCTPALSLTPPLGATSSFARRIIRNVPRAETFLFVLLLLLLPLRYPTLPPPPNPTHPLSSHSFGPHPQRGSLSPLRITPRIRPKIRELFSERDSGGFPCVIENTGSKP